MLAPVKAGARYRRTAAGLAQTSSWLPGTRHLLCSRGCLPEGPVCFPGWGPVCSAPAPSGVGTPTRHCMDTPPPHPFPSSVGKVEILLSLLFPQNGQTVRNLSQNGPEMPQMAGTWTRGASVPGRPLSSGLHAHQPEDAHLLRLSTSDFVSLGDQKTHPTVCFWGW